MMRIYKRRHTFRMILALCCFVKSFPYVHNVYLQIAIYCRYLLYHVLLIGATRLCSVVAGAASSRALPSAAPVSFQPKTQSAMPTTRNDKTRKAVLTFGKTRFLNTKIQEAKETPWIRVFHFWGTGSYLSCSGGPRSNSSGLLRASQPGAAASVRPSRPENDTLYVFCCAPASRTLRVLPAQGPERGVSDRKRKRTPCGVLFLLGSGSYLSFRAVASQVLSAYKGLTSVFGMGTGGTP